MLTNTEMKTLQTLLFKMEGDDFGKVVQMYKTAQSMYQSRAGSSFSIGQPVVFTSSRTGEKIVGKVTKINRKTVQVSTTGKGTWKVSPSLLSSAA
jgi:hypothetical protein